jgi:hypothetical protein
MIRYENDNSQKSTDLKFNIEILFYENSNENSH